jgi:hypothetical protein
MKVFVQLFLLDLKQILMLLLLLQGQHFLLGLHQQKLTE